MEAPPLLVRPCFLLGKLRLLRRRTEMLVCSASLKSRVVSTGVGRGGEEGAALKPS